MVDIYLTIAKFTLNVNDTNLLLKDRDCQIGSKNKVQLYVVNKKRTLNINVYAT